ncbi:hypothetical protein CVT25_015185 [Psilocybe cyanescens]|uniref:Uncharacterized protein n=1 Tax=Psilocybe cyanescens TaxID=93625 RepID=A0A409VZA0_PSICY|nr:hypothetical protein CVT25_015185 [Psilocybe cyanescens]
MARLPHSSRRQESVRKSGNVKSKLLQTYINCGSEDENESENAILTVDQVRMDDSVLTHVARFTFKDRAFIVNLSRAICPPVFEGFTYGQFMAEDTSSAASSAAAAIANSSTTSTAAAASNNNAPTLPAAII